ncbi:MAG: hypothetical protein Q9197_004429 [Variospora fuerteventurae]
MAQKSPPQRRIKLPLLRKASPKEQQPQPKKRIQPKILPPILRLPNELILMIIAHMRNPSVVALSYTCSRFYRISTKVVENIFDWYPYPGESTLRKHDQRDFRRLLTRDKTIIHDRRAQSLGLDIPASWRKCVFKCVGCKMWHNDSSFSLSALRGPAATRQCIFQEGRLWICPVHQWSYNDMRRLCKPNSRAQPSDSPNPAVIQGLCQCKYHFLLFRKTALFQAIPVYLTKGLKPIVKQSALIELYGEMTLRLCPHVSLLRHNLWPSFSPDCKRSFGEPANCCVCDTCATNGKDSNEVRCPQCLTSVQLRTRRIGQHWNEQLILYVVIRRAFTEHKRKWGPFRRTKQTWVNHISLPSEYPGLEAEWRWRWKAIGRPVKFTEADMRSALEEDPFANGFCW